MKKKNLIKKVFAFQFAQKKKRRKIKVRKTAMVAVRTIVSQHIQDHHRTETDEKKRNNVHVHTTEAPANTPHRTKQM